MRKILILWLVSMVMPVEMQAGESRIYSFERPQAATWRSEGVDLSYSEAHWKLGRRSLRIDWRPGGMVRIDDAAGLEQASASRNGGIAMWIYNERAIEAPLRICFFDAEDGSEVCSMEVRLGFRGWRCVWNKFVEDMGKASERRLTSVEFRFPQTQESGTLYFDALEFTPTVSWQKMSDFQVRVHRTDFSLIPDFMKYRLSAPDTAMRAVATAEQIATIESRLEQWYLGSGTSADAWIEKRRAGESEFIRRGVVQSRTYAMNEPLFPMRTPTRIDGERTRYFMDINKRVLLPLALDYRRNGDAESLERALRIYDWFNDQGWADGSSLGSLCFEKLRSAGYFHSLFLLRDELPAEILARELNTMRWMTLFGICSVEPDSPGEVADNLRALALPKLLYALLQPDLTARQTALTAYRDYMNRALDYGPGYFGTFKSDGSGYHHRGPYNSAYYPHALYAGALIAYLLHDTPYALSAESLSHLKQGLLTFRFFCAETRVPSGTAGRFPQGSEVLHELLPAFAYVAYSYPEPDAELLSAARRVMERNPAAVDRLLSAVDSDLSYTSTVGEAEFLWRIRTCPYGPEAAPEGSLFMPYSGLLTVKDSEFQFNVKGFSRYVWDFESSDTENLSGRYLSNGQLEFFDLRNGYRSFHPEEPAFDWSLISGATTILLPGEQLREKRHLKGFSDHRNYSDETFLAGVAPQGGPSMFAFRMHAPAYAGDLRGDKSCYFLGDAVLCLGSGISSTDGDHPTVTALFQSPDGDPEIVRTKRGSLVTDSDGVVYAVSDGTVCVDRRAPFTRAWIDHGKHPRSGSYAYWLVPKRGVGYARSLLSAGGPVEILRQDSVAHLIRVRDGGAVCGALFDASAHHRGMLVERVNTPLAYVLEGERGGVRRLTLCEPDMRRPSVRHMDQLTEAQVIEPERPHATQLVLRGHYTVECQDVVLKVSHTSDHTIVELETVCGRNYELRLRNGR